MIAKNAVQIAAAIALMASAGCQLNSGPNSYSSMVGNRRLPRGCVAFEDTGEYVRTHRRVSGSAGRRALIMYFGTGYEAEDEAAASAIRAGGGVALTDCSISSSFLGLFPVVTIHWTVEGEILYAPGAVPGASE